MIFWLWEKLRFCCKGILYITNLSQRQQKKPGGIFLLHMPGTDGRAVHGRQAFRQDAKRPAAGVFDSVKKLFFQIGIREEGLAHDDLDGFDISHQLRVNGGKIWQGVVHGMIDDVNHLRALVLCHCRQVFVQRV